MGGFIALLRDSFRQAADQKALFVLLILGGVLVLISASVRFDERPPKEVASYLVEELDRFQVGLATVRFGHTDVEVGNVVGPGEDGRVSFIAAFKESRGLRSAHESWQRLTRAKLRRAWTGPGAKPEAYKRRKADQVPDADVVAYVKTELIRRGASAPTVEIADPASDDKPRAIRLRIGYDSADRDHLLGAYGFSIFFGAFSLDLPGGKSLMLLILLNSLVENVVGGIGVIVALIVTAGFVPAILRRGRIDFLLTRPLSRLQLLLGKYVGGLAFVAILAVAIVGASWFVLSAASGIWSPWPLLCPVVLTFFFAILYAASVCVGVITRSTIAVVLVTLGFWLLCSIVGKVHRVLEMGLDEQVPGALSRSLQIAHNVLPRTVDMGVLNQAILRKAYLAEGVTFPGAIDFTTADAWRSLAVSSAWIAFFLTLAWWRFRRRDY